MEGWLESRGLRLEGRDCCRFIDVMGLRLYDFAVHWAMKGDVTFVNSVADGQRVES